MLTLYQPDKYKVYLGRGQSVGFCCVWNDPERVLKECPELANKAAIIGTLYSRQGVNVILRNLALNPQIRKLYVWDAGPLSKTTFGRSGTSLLEKVWAGVADDLEKELEPAAVQKIVAGVELVKVGEQTLSQIVAAVRDEVNVPYMSPQSFSEPVAEPAEVFPSEEIGFLARGRTVLEVWVRALDRVMRYGAVKGTQYGAKQREILGLSWIIEDEDPDAVREQKDWPNNLKQLIGYTNEAIQQYYSIFLSSEVMPGVAYTYGSRLQSYPTAAGPLNQVQEILKRQLRDSLDTRRAVATTLIPEIDKDSPQPPCVTQVQVIQLHGYLHALVTMRTQDIFKAGLPNAFGLRKWQKVLAGEVGLKLGKLQITVGSAHVYEADWGEAKQLLACEVWERPPRLAFDPSLDADRRGYFIIIAQDKKIVANFQSPTGELLLTLEGVSARVISKKIAQLELLSRSDHLLDIGMELQKAEIALAHGFKYVQDRLLQF